MHARSFVLYVVRREDMFSQVCVQLSGVPHPDDGGTTSQVWTGGPHPADGRTPHPTSGCGGYPIQLMGGTPSFLTGGYPIPGLDGGTPPQVWTDGYPSVPPPARIRWDTSPARTEWGTSQPWLDGVPPTARTGWGTLPWPGLDGVPPCPGLNGVNPPPSIRQSSIVSTCYAATGMPLTFTQEDFRVARYYRKILTHQGICVKIIKGRKLLKVDKNVLIRLQNEMSRGKDADAMCKTIYKRSFCTRSHGLSWNLLKVQSVNYGFFSSVTWHSYPLSLCVSARS